jgi:prepilin-type N-terminal cleavage/methylation domain-containing protein
MSPKHHREKIESRLVGHRRRAFTLIEMLIVIGIIAVLTTLLTPAIQGLMGVVGGRGGVGTVSGAIELARLEAIKHGVPSFVGFPAGLTNEEAFNSLIVYRALRADESATNTNKITVVTRWLRLPQGVFVDPQSLDTSLMTTQGVSGIFPRLTSNAVTSVRSLKFDRFGKLGSDVRDAPVLRVGEGVLIGTTLQFAPSPSNYFEVAVQPLTGHVVVRDAAKAAP